VLEWMHGSPLCPRSDISGPAPLITDVSGEIVEMHLSPILAEALGGWFAMYALLWLTAVSLATAGMVAGYLKHWSVLLLSGTSLLIGSYFVQCMFQGSGEVLLIFKLTGPVPVILGLPGPVLWFIRSRDRFKSSNVRVIFYVCLVCALVLGLTIALATR